MTDNPFITPNAELISDEQEYAELKIFTAKGRLGRLRYFTYSVIAMLILQIIVAALIAVTGVQPPADGEPSTGFAIISLAAALPAILIAIVLGIRRLHDMNLSGWFILLALVPIVNILFSLALLFWPGTPGANRYGPPPPPNSTAIKVIAVLLIGILVIGIIATAVPTLIHNAQQPGGADLGLRLTGWTWGTA